VIDAATALAAAFGVVFVAELGDKTQLLALGFGARHRLRVVACGLALGYGGANLVAVIVGGVLGAALPERPIEIVSGTVFLGFALLALRRGLGDDADTKLADATPIAAIDDEPTGPAASSSWRAVGTIGLAIAIAEMGDKTQITTATLASQSAPIGVWVGATLGAAASGMIGAAAGRSIGHRISDRAISMASAGLFAAFGVVMLAGWF
jgi:putative Ca2+/H+ antiporter (TMEM165/GDT1 family)